MTHHPVKRNVSVATTRPARTIVTDDRVLVVIFGSTETAAFGVEGDGVSNTFHVTHARSASGTPSGSPAPSAEPARPAAP